MVNKKNIIFIAEAGQGHEGKPSNIRKFIIKSKSIGINFLKFHIIYADELANHDYKHYKFFKSLEIPQQKWIALSSYAKKNNVNLAFDVLGDKSLKIAELCKARLIKIHSTDIYNYPLQKKINNSKIKNIILSVAGCKKNEIKKAISNLNKKKIIIMYGYQNYPTLSNKLNISKLKNFGNKYDYDLGYADHSSGGVLETIYNCSSAIAHDVIFIEKHFSFNKSIKIEDDESAINDIEFKNLIKVINKCKFNIGLNSINLDFEEKKYRKNVSRSFYTSRFIKKNEKLSFNNIEIKRGKKFNKIDINFLFKSKAKLNIPKNSLIEKNLIKKI